MNASNFSPSSDLSLDLVRESHHRISNHLSLLAGMVQSQARAVGLGPDLLPRATARSLLEEAASKIVSIGHFHRQLAERPAASDVNLCNFLIEAGAAVIGSLVLRERVNLVQCLSANCYVSPDQAQHIGLMLNEIIMNAVKHAHPTGLAVQIQVGCWAGADGRLTIEIADDGVGLPEWTNPDDLNGVGLKLIRALAGKVGAELRMQSDSLGLTYFITLPAHNHALAVATT